MSAADELAGWEKLYLLRGRVEQAMAEFAHPLEQRAAALNGDGPYARLAGVDPDGRARFYVRGGGTRTFEVADLAAVRMPGMSEQAVPPNAPGESIAPGAAEPGEGVPGQADPEADRQQEVAREQEQAREGDEGVEPEPVGDAARQRAGEDDPEDVDPSPTGDGGATGSTTEPAAE